LDNFPTDEGRGDTTNAAAFFERRTLPKKTRKTILSSLDVVDGIRVIAILSIPTLLSLPIVPFRLLRKVFCNLGNEAWHRGASRRRSGIDRTGRKQIDENSIVEEGKI
jgi:hypothetical protein